MSLFAVDPGTRQSALVELAYGSCIGYLMPNPELLAYLRGGSTYRGAQLVIEQVKSFGMPVGQDVFETVLWSGRFVEAWESAGGTWSGIGRLDVKLALCGTVRAKDANIRQALIDRYGGPSAIKKGGPLYGIKSHLWAALAVGVAYQEQQKGVNRGTGQLADQFGSDIDRQRSDRRSRGTV